MKRGEIARHVARGTFFLAVEKTAALLSGMLYFALLLRWLGPTNYGMLTLALAITGLASISTGNFEVFLERFAAEYQARGRFDLLHRAHGIAVVAKGGLGLLASVLLVALSPMLAAQFHLPELAVLLPILTLTVATDGLATTGRSLLFGMQRYEWVSGLSLLFHVAKTVLVGLLWWSRQGLVSLAIGLSALAVLQAVLFSVAAWALAHRSRARHPQPPAPRSRPRPSRRSRARSSSRCSATACRCSARGPRSSPARTSARSCSARCSTRRSSAISRSRSRRSSGSSSSSTRCRRRCCPR